MAADTLASAIAADQTCAVFRRLDPGVLRPGAIHRFVVGEDAGPRVLSPAEAARELGDPVATLLLLKGVFPRTAGEVLTALDAATSPGDPLRTRMFFLLGEGSQIPFTPQTATVRRNLRFLVSTGSPGPDGPDVLLSSFHPDETDVELMAWDRVTGGFNYYRTVGENSAWVFAGNSRHAVTEGTEGRGPFESHTSGNVLMKELRAPWLHWHSPDATILPSVFAPTNPLRRHPWFRGLEPLGAVTCEASVARPSIRRWTRARFESLLSGDSGINRPSRIMRQILDTPTVNLITSHTEGGSGEFSEEVDLPQTFFVDSESLTEILGLQAPPPFAVTGNIYAESLRTFGFRVTDGEKFDRPGDTHFAFAVPERAFEDVAVLGEAIHTGLITARFAACLLMTDFANPIFSHRRRELLRHTPTTATVTAGSSTFSEDMATAIIAAADQAGDDSPEAEFATGWALGEGWKDEFNRRLDAYYTAVTSRLTSQNGFNDYCRLAESRRESVRSLPIAESPLLFPTTTILPAELAMRPDGTIAEVQ